MTIRQILLKAGNQDYIALYNRRLTAKRQLQIIVKQKNSTECPVAFCAFAEAHDMLTEYEQDIKVIMYRAARAVRKEHLSLRLTAAYKALVLGNSREAQKSLDLKEIVRDTKRALVAGDSALAQYCIREDIYIKDRFRMKREILKWLSFVDSVDRHSMRQ